MNSSSLIIFLAFPLLWITQVICHSDDQITLSRNNVGVRFTPPYTCFHGYNKTNICHHEDIAEMIRVISGQFNTILLDYAWKIYNNSLPPHLFDTVMVSLRRTGDLNEILNSTMISNLTEKKISFVYDYGALNKDELSKAREILEGDYKLGGVLNWKECFGDEHNLKEVINITDFIIIRLEMENKFVENVYEFPREKYQLLTNTFEKCEKRLQKMKPNLNVLPEVECRPRNGRREINCWAETNSWTVSSNRSVIFSNAFDFDFNNKPNGWWRISSFQEGSHYNNSSFVEAIPELQVNYSLPPTNNFTFGENVHIFFNPEDVRHYEHVSNSSYSNADLQVLIKLIVEKNGIHSLVLPVQPRLGQEHLPTLEELLDPKSEVANVMRFPIAIANFNKERKRDEDQVQVIMSFGYANPDTGDRSVPQQNSLKWSSFQVSKYLASLANKIHPGTVNALVYSQFDHYSYSKEDPDQEFLEFQQFLKTSNSTDYSFGIYFSISEMCGNYQHYTGLNGNLKGLLENDGIDFAIPIMRKTLSITEEKLPFYQLIEDCHAKLLDLKSKKVIKIITGMYCDFDAHEEQAECLLELNNLSKRNNHSMIIFSAFSKWTKGLARLRKIDTWNFTLDDFEQVPLNGLPEKEESDCGTQTKPTLPPPIQFNRDNVGVLFKPDKDRTPIECYHGSLLNNTKCSKNDVKAMVQLISEIFTSFFFPLSKDLLHLSQEEIENSTAYATAVSLAELNDDKKRQTSAMFGVTKDLSNITVSIAKQANLANQASIILYEYDSFWRTPDLEFGDSHDYSGMIEVLKEADKNGLKKEFKMGVGLPLRACGYFDKNGFLNADIEELINLSDIILLPFHHIKTANEHKLMQNQMEKCREKITSRFAANKKLIPFIHCSPSVTQASFLNCWKMSSDWALEKGFQVIMFEAFDKQFKPESSLQGLRSYSGWWKFNLEQEGEYSKDSFTEKQAILETMQFQLDRSALDKLTVNFNPLVRYNMNDSYSETDSDILLKVISSKFKSIHVSPEAQDVSVVAAKLNVERKTGFDIKQSFTNFHSTLAQADKANDIYPGTVTTLITEDKGSLKRIYSDLKGRYRLGTSLDYNHCKGYLQPVKGISKDGISNVDVVIIEIYYQSLSLKEKQNFYEDFKECEHKLKDIRGNDLLQVIPSIKCNLHSKQFSKDFGSDDKPFAYRTSKDGIYSKREFYECWAFATNLAKENKNVIIYDAFDSPANGNDGDWGWWHLGNKSEVDYTINSFKEKISDVCI